MFSDDFSRFSDGIEIHHISFCFILGSISGCVLDSFWIDFGAFGGQKFANMSSKINTKMVIEKSSFRRGPSAKKLPWLVPAGGNGGGLEEKKKGIRKVRKFGGTEDSYVGKVR